MSIQHMDFPSGSDGLWGYGSYDELNDADDGIYAYIRKAGDDVESGCSMVEDPDPNVTGACLTTRRTLTNNYTEQLRYVLSSGKTTVGVAFRLYLPSLPSANVYTPPVINFNDSGNNREICLTMDTTGALRVKYDMNDTEEQYVTPGPVLVAGTWYHIEIKVDYTAGDIEVRVEGVPQIELTGQDIGTGPCAQIALGCQNGVGEIQSPDRIYYKDLVIWDGDGSVNNDFLGSVQVYDLAPTADDSFNWTASTGSTGYNLVDEAPPNDGDYIYADDTPPAASTFEMSDLPEDVSSIRGIKTFSRARKTDGGDGWMQVSLVSNGTDGNGTDRPVTTNFTYWMDVFELDPDTSANWTRSGVNAALLKIDRTL